MSETKAAGDRNYDAIVIGGGLIGLTTAIGLAGYGVRTVVLDREPMSTKLEPAFDGRATAVAYASQKLFGALGIWQGMAAHAQPIEEIRVSDGPSLLHLHFDHRDLGDEPLGYLVENRYIRHALTARAQEIDLLDVLAPETVDSVTRDAGGVRVRLASGRTVAAPLLLACDGRNSQLRTQAGIDTMHWQYNQTAIVATIMHSLPHCGIAHERFLPDGPFAILPLPGNASSLVWTVPTRKAAAIMGLGERGFTAEVYRRVGDFLGDIDVRGPRWSYPLGLHVADRFTDTRMALIGDAAHGIHPIAGQGFNLGLRDVAALVEGVVEAQRLGLDIGSAEVLAQYESWRRGDTLMLAGVTDVLNRLFSNDVAPVRIARDLGLAAVNRVGPLKRFFMSHARGTVGRRPALLDGHPL